MEGFNMKDPAPLKIKDPEPLPIQDTVATLPEADDALSDEQLIRRLEKTEGCTIERTNTDTFPGVVQPEWREGVGAVKGKLFDRLIHTCRSYYSGVMIIDRFGNQHSERRVWRDGLQERYGEAYRRLKSRDKLRLNVITTVCTGLMNLADSLARAGVDDEQTRYLSRLIDTLPSGVDIIPSLSDEQKASLEKNRQRVEAAKLKFKNTDKLAAVYKSMTLDQKRQVVARIDSIADEFLSTVFGSKADREDVLREAA